MHRRPQPKKGAPEWSNGPGEGKASVKEPGDSFGGEYTYGGLQASEGWFNKFKVGQSLHSIKIVGEAGSAAERYLEEFVNLVADGGYKPEQVLNVYKSALF
ncbi:unnamed protein product [Parnassius apollo]|uniref:(apollo) hypothetical protein n=1 Tax=Parnassius apollo TaxID=110799 RepID=A0A8S3XLF5_PARAO|nr:unnamed protein product [Parnassius apollo]